MQNKKYSGTQMPRQKLFYNEKIENDNEWGKACIDAALLKVGIKTDSRRSSKERKQRNYNLFNGVFDKNDMSVEVIPKSLQGFTFPAELQYRDIVSPIFTLLFGEEIRRGTSFVVRNNSEDGIRDKDEKKKQAVLQKLQEFLVSENPENPEEAIKEVSKYYTYTYQDIRERTATHLLTYLRQYLKLDQEFARAWEDVLLAGEEIYETDIIGGAPIARKQNPLEVDFVLSNNSDKLDDAAVITMDRFMPINQVIDEYWNVLTDSEIEDLEDNNQSKIDNVLTPFPTKQTIELGTGLTPTDNTFYFDNEGNVRVSKVVWASMKKIGKVTYMDENEEQQFVYVDETYKGDKENKDEVIDWFWITEYWEGTRIKDNIYKNIGPRRLQYRSIDNISKAKSGFVGTVYNCNNAESISLMDRLVPWIYQYIVMWYRTDLLIAANQGKIAIIDESLVPEGWDVDKWMYYATIMKFAFVNSYNEGKKGERTGKINPSTQNKTLDLETGNSIQHHISILDYIERKIHDISGVSQQRLGEIQASEGVGNVQRSVTQSAIITEKWFQIHNWTKQRVLEQLIETAKVAYSEDKRKLQYVTDDLGTVFFDFDGTEFTNDQFNVFVSDSIKDQQVLDAVKQLAQAALQNDKTELSSVVDVITSNSTAEVKNKLKETELKAIQREQAQIKATDDNEKAAIAAQNRAIELDNWNREQDRQTKLRIAEIQSLGFEKGDETNIVNQTKLALEERKQAFIERQADHQNSQDEMSARLKEKDIEMKRQIKEKEIKLKKEIADKKLINDKNKLKNKPKASK